MDTPQQILIGSYPMNNRLPASLTTYWPPAPESIQLKNRYTLICWMFGLNELKLSYLVQSSSSILLRHTMQTPSDAPGENAVGDSLNKRSP